jgi:hypothetical protein
MQDNGNRAGWGPGSDSIMEARGPSAGPVDELEGTGPPLSPVEACDTDRDSGRRDELQEKGRAALRARLFASQSKSTSGMLPDLGACMHGPVNMTRACHVAADSTKRLQMKQEDELLEAKEDEMEALASSLQLSISVGQEATRDTDTLLKSLKISEVRVSTRADTAGARMQCRRLLRLMSQISVTHQIQEGRTEERARALNMRNRLLNAEAKLLVVEQTSSGYEAQLIEKEREAQELRHKLQVQFVVAHNNMLLIIIVIIVIIVIIP